MIGLGLGSSGAGGAPRARTINASVPLTAGLLTTVSSYGLLAPVTFSGSGNANLSINNSTGGVSATVALGAGVTQSMTGTITGADNVVLPFSLNCTGQVSVPGVALISASPGNGQNTITVIDGATNGSAISVRKLYRSTTPGFVPSTGNLVNANITSPYVDSGLTNGTIYYYQVILANGVGEGLPSNEASGAPIAFVTLPSLGQAYSAVRSTQVMVPGFSGNLFRLRNAANSSFVDIAPALGSNLPADATIAAAVTALGGTAYFVRVYDQTGNGFDLTLPTSNGATVAVDVTQKTQSGALWVNSADSSSGEMTSTGHTINNQNFSFFTVMQTPSCNMGGSNMWAIDDGTNTIEGALAGPCGSNIRSKSTVSGFVSYAATLPLRSNPIVLGQTNTAGSRRLYQNETSTTAVAGAAGTANRVQYFGAMKAGGLPGYCRWAGDALLSGALSTLDGTTIQSSLSTIFSIPTAFDRRLLTIGDSIAYGYLQNYHHNIWEQLSLTSASNVELICVNLPGMQMGAIGASVFPTVYITPAYGAGKMVTTLELGINDLDTGVGNQNYTTLAGRATSVINSLKSAYTGGRVLQTQLLPQAGGGWNGTQEGYRISYNVDVAANSYAAHAVFLQGDTSSTMGAPPTYPGGTGGAPNNSAYYNTDKLHPTQTGASLLAVGGQASPPSGFSSYQSAINSLWF